MKFKPAAVTAALAAATLLLSACSGGGGSTASGAGDAGGNLGENRVIYYSIGPNDSLDPLTPVNANAFAQTALMSVYDRLVEFDEQGNPIPGLAESWEFTDEALTTLELTLRDGVTFHDGEALDAEAVVLNLQRTIDMQETASPTVQEVVADFESVEAVDESTVRITMTSGRSALPYDLGQQIGMMMSPASFANGEAGADLAGIGAGPYVLEENVPERYTKLTAYEDYWNGGVEERASAFEVHNVQDAQTRLNALRSGQADIISLDAAVIDQARQAELEVMTFAGLGVWMNYLNTSGVLNDERVRQALMYATDSQLLSDNLFGGVSEPANQVFPPGYALFNDDRTTDYEYDVDKAKELLAEAGYADGVEIHFVQLNMGEILSLFEALQQMWAEAGITLKVTTIDVSQFGDYVNGSLGDMMLAGWGGRADPQVTLQMLAGTGGTYAPAGATNPRIDELLEEAASIDPGDPQRNEVLTEASMLVLDEASLVPFMTRPVVYAAQDGCIEGLSPYPAIASGNWANVTKTDACR